jgi:predicted Zn-dependent protease
VCGECHTAAGRVLPEDDLHQGHDLVQVWHRDPHATGVRRSFHNRFCARCHSPFRGEFGDAEAAAARRLFSERKETITCIACHDPHDLTHPDYGREQALLGPPLPPKRHVYRGDDADFATPDYAEMRTNTEVCVQCHRGADRIDLDHANATCSDCHNAFARNRSRESRPFHDSNHPRLSCRPCHRDADHLMSVAYGDRDFLQPEHIHNLRTLPPEVVAKHGFRYPSLRRAIVVTAEAPAAPASGAVAPAPDEAEEALRGLLAAQPHARLAEQDEVSALQRALLDHPQDTRRYLDLGLAYAELGEQGASREIIDYVAHRDSPWRVLEVPGESTPAAGGAAEADARLLATTLLPPSADARPAVLRLWVEAQLLLARGASDAAADRLRQARVLDPDDGALRVSLALAELGRGQADEAAELLEAARVVQPDGRTAAVALAVARLELGQFGRARALLEETLRAWPRDPVAAYVLGRGSLARRAPEAVAALQRAVAAAPGLADAWLALGDAYRMAGAPAAAADAYGQAVGRAPDAFAAHLAFANALKWSSDALRFQHAGQREAAPAAGAEAFAWRKTLTALAGQADAYAERALKEYGRALTLRPLDGDIILQVGEVYRRSGHLEQARDVFAWLARRRPEQWLPHYRLGAVLVQLDRLPEATAALEEAR